VNVDIKTQTHEDEMLNVRDEVELMRSAAAEAKSKLEGELRKGEGRRPPGEKGRVLVVSIDILKQLHITVQICVSEVDINKFHLT
jgi:hypothetical protein